MPTTAERESARLAWRIGIGRGDPPEPEPEPEAPTAPVLSVDSVVGTTVTLSGVIDNTVGEGDSYQVQAQADGGDWSVLIIDDTGTISAGENAADEIDADLDMTGEDAGTYDVRMRVRAGSGPWSDWSNVVDVVIEEAYDAATSAWIDAVVLAGGTVSEMQSARVDALVTALKGHSIFTKLDRLWLFAGESDADQATIDIINLGVATPQGTITLAAGGYTGNGSTGYLQSGFTPSSAGGVMTQNSAHIGVYDRTSRGSAIGNKQMGALGANGAETYMEVQLFDAFWAEINAANYSSKSNANAQGSYTIVRPNSEKVTFYKNGSNLGDGTGGGSTGFTNAEFYICASNNNGTPSGFSTDQIAACWFGGALTDTEVANLHDAINDYMTAWGVNVY